MWPKFVTNFFLWTLVALAFVRPARAAIPNLGVHILHPEEMADAARLIKTADNRDRWTYVTMTLSLDDLSEHDRWQAAFRTARRAHIQPIVRLVTQYDPSSDAWAIPTRGQILSYFDFLNSLTWPKSERYIIVFNEPNHASEWGGQLDPASYAAALRFTAAWAHTEPADYKVLPGAMDLAAPNGPDTWEAFHYLSGMLEAEPDLFAHLDAWNSHSYPNPAFSSSPTDTGQNKLSGYTYELAWLQERTGREWSTFITETGWQATARTKKYLYDYYAYANEHIWNDEHILGITPFVLRGDPGPFAGFSLLDRDSQPTLQYEALARQVERNALAWRQEYQDQLAHREAFIVQAAEILQ
ncbi:hypothetical protein IJJ12_01140 [bacterium]|nr:hypothetical protein [bacterium]